MPEHRARSRWTPAGVAAVTAAAFLAAGLASMVATLAGLWPPFGLGVAGVLLVVAIAFGAWSDGHRSGSSSGAP